MPVWPGAFGGVHAESRAPRAAPHVAVAVSQQRIRFVAQAHALAQTTYTIDADKPELVGKDHCAWSPKSVETCPDALCRRGLPGQTAHLSRNLNANSETNWVRLQLRRCVPALEGYDQGRQGGPSARHRPLIAQTYSSAGDSGKQVVRSFCGTCGSPIAHAPDAAPEVRLMRCGSAALARRRLASPAACFGHPTILRTDDSRRLLRSLALRQSSDHGQIIAIKAGTLDKDQKKKLVPEHDVRRH